MQISHFWWRERPGKQSSSVSGIRHCWVNIRFTIAGEVAANLHYRPQRSDGRCFFFAVDLVYLRTTTQNYSENRANYFYKCFSDLMFKCILYVKSWRCCYTIEIFQIRHHLRRDKPAIYMKSFLTLVFIIVYQFMISILIYACPVLNITLLICRYDGEAFFQQLVMSITALKGKKNKTHKQIRWLHYCTWAYKLKVCMGTLLY